jgi:hypothetical protein
MLELVRRRHRRRDAGAQGRHVGDAPATGIVWQRKALLLHQYLREQQVNNVQGLFPTSAALWSCLPRKAEAAAEEDDADDDVGCYGYGLSRHRCSDAGWV